MNFIFTTQIISRNIDEGRNNYNTMDMYDKANGITFLATSRPTRG